MTDYKKAYEEWLSNPYFDEKTKEELRSIADNDNEIKERFYTDLEFGTGGLRGIIGAGTNRMNVYTVRKATQGLANYIKRMNACEKGVAIAFDSRRMSPEFADVAALCLNANGIKAYVFESLRPTPVLSYAVRYLGATAGINITASHNPPEYNGYKVYWEDGAQIIPPHDVEILKEVKNVTDFSKALTMDKDEAIKKGLYNVIGKEIDDTYTETLKKLVMRPEAIKEWGDKLKIVYTPLHGTGNLPVRRVLKELGFKNVTVVPEQELPDGNFPTVSYPNPEAKEAFALGLALAKKIDADLVLANDPDADRLGVYVKDTKSGEYISLTGNMSGCLLADYEIMSKKEKNGKLPDDGMLITTIVSTNMAKDIADYYKTGYTEVLTGFKFIGGKMREFEETGKGTYLFGFEESYGCLIGDHARDKDAVVATMALCEAAAYYKTKNMTLWDAMIALYERYGYYKDDIISVTMKGITGLQKIGEIMETLRKNPVKEISGLKTLAVRDYKLDTRQDLKTGEITKTGLPNSNVLYYELENNSYLCVRPSGTEPKIKLYFGVKGTSLEDADARSKKLGAEVKALLESM
ncbi:MAG: phospho-sugar mutase [Lachnospiraceae bacterium]|nr:phospho-sugar mutase [Lachnospiraceae bacterium]